MQDLYLISKIPPSVNHYIAYRTVYKNGRPMSMSYKTKESLEFKKEFSEYLIQEVKNQGWDLEVNKTQHFYIDTIYYFRAKGSDPSNYFKLLLDTITDTQKIWIDDDVALERVQAVYYDSLNPRMEIHIHPVEYIGIFNNTDELNDFKSRCLMCKYNKRNCSVLKKAVDGKIQEEITREDNILRCFKYKQIKNK